MRSSKPVSGHSTNIWIKKIRPKEKTKYPNNMSKHFSFQQHIRISSQIPIIMLRYFSESRFSKGRGLRSIISWKCIQEVCLQRKAWLTGIEAAEKNHWPHLRMFSFFVSTCEFVLQTECCHFDLWKERGRSNWEAPVVFLHRTLYRGGAPPRNILFPFFSMR